MRAASTLALGALLAGAAWAETPPEAASTPAGAVSAQGQLPAQIQTLRTRSLAATCAACHGTGGRAPPTASLPGLAGMPAATLIAKMTAFKSGARPGSVMPQLAQGFSAVQIEQLAHWFAASPP